MQIQPETLRYLRQMFGFSTRQLAKQVGFSYAYISKIERGERRLTDEAKRRFMQVYSELIKQQMEKGEDVNAKQKINV